MRPCPLIGGHVERRANLLRCERQERVQQDAERANRLNARVDRRRRSHHVGLATGPWGASVDVAIALAEGFHDATEGGLEAGGFDVGGDFGGEFVNLREQIGFERFGVRCGGHFAGEVVGDDLLPAVDEVAERGDEFGVVALHEVVEAPTGALRLGGVDRQVVPKRVGVESVEIIFDPYGRAAGLADFLFFLAGEFDVEECVGYDVVGQLIVPRSFGAGVGAAAFLHFRCRELRAHEHRGPDEGVEDDVVLADEVDNLAIGVLPPVAVFLGVAVALPAKLGGEADVADGGVEPDIEHFARRVRVVERDGHAPGEVAGHGPLGEAGLDGAEREVCDDGPPVERGETEPVGEHALKLVELEIPVGRGSRFGARTGDDADRVDEFQGVDAVATLLALVAECGGVVAGQTVGKLVIATAGDVAVGEEFLRLSVVELFGRALHEMAVAVDCFEEVLTDSVVGFDEGGLVRTAVDVEADAEACEVCGLPRVVTGGEFRGGGVFLAREDFDCDAVVVAAADEADVVAVGAEVADEDVSGEVCAGDVADVESAVGVGERGGDEVFAVHWFGSLYEGRSECAVRVRPTKGVAESE